MDSDEIDREIRMAAERIAIPLHEAWLPTVRAHLAAIRTADGALESFTLPDEIDQAPVFEA